MSGLRGTRLTSAVVRRLDGNFLGEDGVAAFAEAFKHNKTLMFFS